MIDILKAALHNYMKVAPHVNRIKDNRLRVYELSKELPTEQGMELIKLMDNTIEETEKVYKKIHERNDRKDD